MNASQITVSAYRQAELESISLDAEQGDDEVCGQTLVSLISPGTELNYLYNNENWR